MAPSLHACPKCRCQLLALLCWSHSLGNGPAKCFTPGAGDDAGDGDILSPGWESLCQKCSSKGQKGENPKTLMTACATGA